MRAYLFEIGAWLLAAAFLIWWAVPIGQHILRPRADTAPADDPKLNQAYDALIFADLRLRREIQQLREERDMALVNEAVYYEAREAAEAALARFNVTETEMNVRAERDRLADALRWYDDHKRDDGSYDGEMWGDLTALAGAPLTNREKWDAIQDEAAALEAADGTPGDTEPGPRWHDGWEALGEES